MTSLKVDNLTYRTSPDTLRRVFEKYGRVGDVYIPRDRYTKESRGFAFVRFHDKRDAEDAMDAMDGAVLDGRELRVQMARYGRPPDSHHSRRGRRSRSPRRRRRSLPADPSQRAHETVTGEEGRITQDPSSSTPQDTQLPAGEV
ncbi:serine/arginine-rich splicing factor 2-like [Urocitellus parryii]